MMREPVAVWVLAGPPPYEGHEAWREDAEGVVPVRDEVHDDMGAAVWCGGVLALAGRGPAGAADAKTDCRGTAHRTKRAVAASLEAGRAPRAGAAPPTPLPTMPE
ncbi:MAG TPA: hypothetical protein VFN61_12470 [Acidimicrobiales bacterium]|nr:hypothetical protein [Acidimicrobiales bacterium]